MPKLDFAHYATILCSIITTSAVFWLARLSGSQVSELASIATAVGGIATAVASVAACIVGLLKVSTPKDAAALAKCAQLHADLPTNNAAKTPLGRALWPVAGACVCLALALSGCGWLSAHPTAVPVAETIACDVASALDPSQAVLICAGIDAAGSIVESFEPVPTSAASAQAFARRFPSVPAVHALAVKGAAR
jgi:hypothetical protein